MSLENRSGSIVHVTATRSSALRARLRDATSFEVRSATPEAITGGSDTLPVFDPGSDHGTQDLAAVVLELECPDRTTDVLERVATTIPTVPAIVTPPTGSEALAAAALRANADEYVPLGDTDEPVDRIVDTIRSAAGSPGTEPPEPSDDAADEFHRILANDLPDEAFVIDEDGRYLEAKVRSDAEDRYSLPAAELRGKRLDDVFPDETATELRACIDRTLRVGDVQSVEYAAETSDGRRRYEARVVPIEDRIGGQRAVVWLARDITERARRERELRSRQDRLERLNRISTVAGEVIDTLVEAPSRDAVEREVCDQLVDSELYCGAWIAERTGEGSLSARTSAGDAEASLERIDELAGTDDWPIRRAVRTGEVQTETDVPTNETVPEPIREAAREDGVGSALAVPISHSESIYGVLTVLADREEAFSDGERAMFSLLGETIGFTIMAVKNRQLLFADTVVELEFRIDGGGTFSFDLSERYDCTISLEWAGTTSNGRTVQYVTVDGLDGETVLAEAHTHDSIEECRLIHDGARRCTIEMQLSESGVRTLANYGATIRDVTVEDGVGTCLIEVSQEADVREIAEALTVIYENTELVARREIDRPVRTAVERRDRIFDRLTDRQLTTLRLAYYSGFFDWPRESTGEEIAEAMDVSPPTMHQHLRKALKTVLGEFFEAGGGTEVD